MFQIPSSDILQALTNFVGECGISLERCEASPWLGNAYRFDLDDRRFIFAGLNESVGSGELVKLIRAAPLIEEDSNIYEVAVVITTNTELSEPLSVKLGVRAYSVHDGIAYLSGLPRAWRESQTLVLREALRGASLAETLAEQLDEVVELRIAQDTSPLDDSTPPERAQGWLSSRLHWSSPDGDDKLVYLRGEAGKGKSTTIAAFAASKLSSGTGPLPVMVPLRELKRAAGVSMDAISARLGVTGPDDVQRFARAVRSGLIALLLDGLDEVAGRYDPKVVEDVLTLIVTQLLTPSARIVISGRTTESALVDRRRAHIGSIELPGVLDDEFVQYVSGVVERTVASWTKILPRIPEPLFGVDDPTSLPDRSPTSAERQLIEDWIGLVFEWLGKERSLFFVQSLAGAARSMQLDGNRPIIIRNASGVPQRIADPSVQDVCLLAASLACVREQDKVEASATSAFGPEGQLDLLTWFSVLSAVPESTRSTLPLPNSLAKSIFAVDPVHDNETFTAIVRQMQKHALLYAGGTQSTKAADWRPTFLSDWVRAALLVRAWQSRNKLAAEFAGPFSSAIVRAERARLAFVNLFTSLSDEQLGELIEQLCIESRSGSPEASANYFALLSGTSQNQRADLIKAHAALVDGADLTELTLNGIDFGREFSPHMVFLDGTEFVNCRFSGCQFQASSLSEVVFTSCTFEGVRFEDCEGTAYFDDCTFSSSRFKDCRSPSDPVFFFIDCHFGAKSRIDQTIACSQTTSSRIAVFMDCTMSVNTAGEMIGGDWTGLDHKRIVGIAKKPQGATVDPEVATLRSMLKTFFPSRVGIGAQRQVRPYIRSSALGRGSLPKGAPSGDAMFRILEAFGFADGGRANHLYAPWSSVVGGGPDAMAFRNELNEFLQKDARSPRVVQLLDRIRRSGTW